MRMSVNSPKESSIIDKLQEKIVKNKQFQQDCANEKINKCDAQDTYELAIKYNIS